MVKKITKFLKFAVCCALIISLVAPAYAALSASDGSAFVTKAEFDAALADFNSRLTTFEAGINSKIDSQVTSYLDRNGIWSGKAQELDPGVVSPSKSVNGYYKVLEGMAFRKKTTDTFDNNGIEALMSRNLLKSLVIVPEMNKSGLCYFQSYVGRDDGGSDFRMNIGWTSSSTGDTAYTAMGVNNSKGVFYGYEIFERDSSGSGSLLEALSMADEVCFPTDTQDVSEAGVARTRIKGYWGISVSSGVRTKLFFVHRGYSLVCEEIFQCNLNGYATDRMYLRPNWAACSEATSGWFIVNCTVY